MTPTAYADFVTALAGLTITGVTRKFAYPPQSVATADLPALFPMVPSGEEGPMTFDGGGGWPTLKADLIIAYEPVGQNTAAANFPATVAMMDNVAAALRGVAAGTLAKSKPRWTVRQTIVEIGEVAYWAVQATVTVNG